MNDQSTAESKWYRVYDLSEARERGSAKVPFPHQATALDKLDEWCRVKEAGPRGAVLVMATGGGKTLTALRFLCRSPLSDGYKVLWLANSHFLLEQALNGLEDAAAQIARPRSSLKARVVSGKQDTPGRHRSRRPTTWSSRPCQRWSMR